VVIGSPAPAQSPRTFAKKALEERKAQLKKGAGSRASLRSDDHSERQYCFWGRLCVELALLINVTFLCVVAATLA